MVNKKTRKTIDILMTLLLILIGIIVIKFWIEIVGWFIIIISLMARHKDIIEFIKDVPKSVEGLFGGSKEGQKVENSENVVQTGTIRGNVTNIFQGRNAKIKKKPKKGDRKKFC